MPLLGVHMSTAGGLSEAFGRIDEVRGQALQIFTTNVRQWKASPLKKDDIQAFIEKWQTSGSMPVAAHDSYLINLAAPPGEILDKSIAAFANELTRAAQLKIAYLVTHPGAHGGDGAEVALKRFVKNLDQAITKSQVKDVMVLLETTAGQGSSLGARFEEIQMVLEHSKHSDQLGVCFDTCHVFAAGYDLRSPAAYEQTFQSFDKTIGLTRLRMFHLNDSKKDLGSRVDRHEHIGQGKLGKEAFAMLLNDKRFKHHPMILETPKENGLEKDMENLKTLRDLLKK